MESARSASMGGLAVRVEYDASRLGESTVAALLRRAGLDVREKVTSS